MSPTATVYADWLSINFSSDAIGKKVFDLCLSCEIRGRACSQNTNFFKNYWIWNMKYLRRIRYLMLTIIYQSHCKLSHALIYLCTKCKCLSRISRDAHFEKRLLFLSQHNVLKISVRVSKTTPLHVFILQLAFIFSTGVD